MTNQIQAIVTIQNDQLTTTSNNIADVFGKRHDHVLRAIDNLLLELPEEHRPNFGETVNYRENPSGGEPIASRNFTITRDGFTLLAMGFTGKKALAFKLAYIDQFNAMEKALQQPCIKNNQLDTHQARFIQEAVNNMVHKTGKHWNKIYHDIKTVFKVRSYTEATQEQFPALCEYLGVVYSGEFIAATEAPKALPADKVLVSREYLTGLINMVELQRERFYLVEQAEEQIQYAFNMLSVMVSGQMKQANDAVREARYRMHDPLTHAKSYANMLKHQLA